MAEFFEAGVLPLHEDGASDEPARDHPDPKGLVKPRYNVAPTSNVYIVADFEGVRTLTVARWGLIPSWSKDASRASGMINARSESVAEKPAYRAAFRRRRCLVPADGYYEWQAASAGKSKQPYFIRRRDGDMLAMAGLYEHWSGPTGVVRSCTIITQEAVGDLCDVHHRRPVQIPAESWAEWLDPESSRAPDVMEAAIQAVDASENLAWQAVSTAVNRPTQDGEHLIAPLDHATAHGAR